MTFRKITVDVSVKHIRQSEQTRERDRVSKRNTLKNKSLPVNKTKKISEKIKEFITDNIRGE